MTPSFAGLRREEMSNTTVWAVHLLTASGAAWALLAIVAATHADWQLVFIYNGIAMIVDGVDGTFARRLRVRERLPWFDGGGLDFVVDYVNYVFVAAVVVVDGGLLQEPYATIAGLIVAIIGALYFADTRMKTPDQSFRGFPAIWNFLVFVLMVYRPPEIVTMLLILVCAALTFSPIEFIHPVRVIRGRPVTLAVTVAWGILGAITLIDDLKPSLTVLILFGIANIYLAVVGAVLQFMRDR